MSREELAAMKGRRLRLGGETQSRYPVLKEQARWKDGGVSGFGRGISLLPGVMKAAPKL